MSRSGSMKTVFPGGFIRCRPLMGWHGRLVDDPACQLCQRASCATAWLHIEIHTEDDGRRHWSAGVGFVCDRCMAGELGEVGVFENGEAIAARLRTIAVLGWRNA